MTYIKVFWRYNLIDEPVELYSELDNSRNEIRKIEVYRNGMFGYAGFGMAYNNTFLSEYEIPDIKAINQDKQFLAETISKEDFEKMWEFATDRSNL